MALTARRARIVPALAVLALLATGCGGADEGAPDGAATSATASDGGSASVPAASDGGADGTPAPSEDADATEDDATGDDTTEDGSAAGTDGEDAAAPVPYAVSPAPEGFTPPPPCTGEGAHYGRVGEGPVSPALPERDGETVELTVTGIDGDRAELEARVGDEEPRAVEAAGIGETVGIEGWTISLTSICTDRQQVEFDLID